MTIQNSKVTILHYDNYKRILYLEQGDAKMPQSGQVKVKKWKIFNVFINLIVSSKVKIQKTI